MSFIKIASFTALSGLLTLLSGFNMANLDSDKEKMERYEREAELYSIDGEYGFRGLSFGENGFRGPKDVKVKYKGTISDEDGIGGPLHDYDNKELSS